MWGGAKENEVGDLLRAQMGSRATFKDIRAACEWRHLFLALSGRMIWTKNLSLSIWTFPLSFPQPLWWIIQKRRAWNETRRDGGLLRIEHAAVSPSPISAQQRGTLIRRHGWFRMSLLTVYHSLAAPPGAVGPSTLGLGHARKSGGGSGYQEVSGSKDVESET